MWTTEAIEAFVKLKSSFTQALVLMHPVPARQFVVEVDTSDTGIGTVLSQQDPMTRSAIPVHFSPSASHKRKEIMVCIYIYIHI